MVDVEIVERLAAEGLRVDCKHLNKILHNPFYCGKITHNLLGDEVVDGKQEIFRSISTSYKVEKEKAASEKSHLSPLVGMRRLERPTPTSRT